MRVLVTGGAGYIGSHMVKTLIAAGHQVVVVDDLSAGHRDAVAPAATFVQADIRDAPAIRAALDGTDAVVHFAARIQVGESVQDPAKYYKDNLAATLSFLETLLGVAGKRPLPFVFSSTAAVYGDPIRVPIDEDHPLVPSNPYGDTKLAVERALAAYGRAYGLRWAALRYFNAAGANVAAGLSERHHPETHLIPLVLDAASGKGKPIDVFGTDWDTPDGTCVRDYVHVEDLADAHLAAIAYLERGGASGAFNLGTGRGNSVREVIRVVSEVTGREVPSRDAPRRAGDPPTLVAAVDRAARLLGWRASRSDLRRIIEDAWSVRGPAS